VANALAGALNDAVLRRLAGAEVYRWGTEYKRRVVSCEATGAELNCVVRGSRDYRVALRADEGVLDYACDCAEGAQGAFCKHCVAAGLAWLDQGRKPKKAGRAKRGRKLTLADAGEILRSEHVADLVSTLLVWAQDDRTLRERLIFHAARLAGNEDAVATVGSALKDAIRVRGFVFYGQSHAYARKVNSAIDEVERLLRQGHAAAVAELCESALPALAKAMGSFDDSAGHMTVLRSRLEDIHMQACTEAPPDPLDLARRLFQCEANSGFDVFYDSINKYAELLGQTGRDEFKRLAEAEWARLSGARTREMRYQPLTGILERLAKEAGDADRLADLMSCDLSHSWDYLRIAEMYAEHDQHEKALAWAEKGLGAFPKDARLSEFAAEEYQRRGIHDRALELAWASFIQQPSVASWGALRKQAIGAGVWPQWRERALDEIRRAIAKATRRVNQWELPRSDHSLLVEVFLADGDIDAAWREAQTGGCTTGIWLLLAEVRAKTHPEDAARVYLQQVEPAIRHVSNSKYEHVLDLLLEAAPLMKSCGRQEEFRAFVAELRVRHKARRSLIALLDQHRAEL
jgi:uncharacterized Zn finger protein